MAAHEMFGDVAAHRPSRSRFRRVLTATSIVLHAIVISAIVVVQVFAVGALPVPHRPLIFEELRLAQLIEVPLPPPPPRQATGNSSPVSLDAAPVVVPLAITAETGREREHTIVTPGAVVNVEQGGNGFDLLSPCKGCVTGPPPPPPPPPPAPTPVRLHAGMQAPVKIVNVDPIYPQVAQTAHIRGVVILEAIIDERGFVKSVSVLRSIQLLDRAAVDAVKQWRFTPARLNGDAVPVVMTVTVNFELDR
jgi:protein TonB